MERIINAIIAAEDNPLQFNVILNVVEDLAQPGERDVERVVRVRNDNYFEGVIPQYTDVSFKQHFRMSRDTVDVSTAFRKNGNSKASESEHQKNLILHVVFDRNMAYFFFL